MVFIFGVKQTRKFNGKNPYYNPEECGLNLVDSLEGEQDYSFDILAVWKDKDSGKFYFVSDSGCSCPVPFEDVRGLDDFEELNKDSFHSLKEKAKNLYRVDKNELSRFVSKMRRKI